MRSKSVAISIHSTAGTAPTSVEAIETFLAESLAKSR
jgi:hypothetical protein